MANVKISELTAITSSDDLADADIVPIVDSSDSTTKRTALSVLCSYFGSGGGGSSVWCTGDDTAYLLTDCVGIGTATPEHLFSVAGNAGFDEYLYHNGDSDTAIRFQTDIIDLRAGNWSMMKIDQDNGKITVNNSNQNVDFQVKSDDGTQLIRTDAANNRVGIGTGAPAALFHVQGDSCYTGDLKISGDVCIGGDDLFMNTNTSGYMLIADGTNFNPVAMSGDVAIDSAGATTIQATSVDNSMLAGSIANAKLSNSSITLSDGSNTTAISLGGTMTFSGTSNEIEVAESSGTVTIGLPVCVTGLTTVCATNFAGTLATAAQTNVTSLGTLTALTVDSLCLNGTTIGHTSDTDLITLADGAVTIAGDLTISGDDLTMGTNTSGALLVADGTNYNPVVMSGDATISSAGAVTLAATNTNLTTLANVTTVGALNSGSITSGFGTIDTGSSTITTTGAIAAGALTATGDISFDGGTFVFNESGADKDFRIEGDTDANLFFVDASTDRIGIGTTTPDYTLDVAGDVGFDEYIYHNGDADTYIRMRGDQFDFVAGNMTFLTLDESSGASADTVTVNHGDNDIDFLVNSDDGTQLIRTDAENNRVGIGTETPATMLHVQGATCVTGAVNVGGDLTISGDDLIMGTNTSGYLLVADGTNYNPVAVSGDVTINSSGAVTIAATSVENSMLAGSIANAKLSNSSVSYGGVSLSLGGTDATPAFNLCDATAYKGDSALVTVGTVTSGTWQGTAVAAAYVAAAQTNITSLGTLTALTASGNVSFDGGTFVFNESGADLDFRIEGDSDANLLIADASTDRIGIGTATPDYLLSVAGNAGFDEYIYHNGDSNTAIRFQTDIIDLRAGNWTMIKLDQGNNKVTINNGNQDLDFQVKSDDGTQLIRTDAANNRVGIGTGSPATLLHVQGAACVTGAVDVGDVITGGTIEATTDTAASDNAAMGYTSAEGLILTGQGTTNDYTIKNDADLPVIVNPTGLQTVRMGRLTSCSDTGEHVALVLKNKQSTVTTDAAVSLRFETVENDAIGQGSKILVGRSADYGTAGNLSDYMAFSTMASNSESEKVRILSGGGITFNGDTATANALDDYEEGTWNVCIRDGSNNAMTNTVGYTCGLYTKIGNVVYVSVFASTTSLGSTSGQIYICGFPYTVGGGGNSQAEYTAVATGYASGMAITAGTYVSANIIKGSTYATLRHWDDATGVSGLQASEWSADGTAIFSGYYFVD